ncbi:alanine--tRNA ligase, partial [Candidatus Woesearchaeota archaeon]|nr:alanine--tRNA ligase [Candidatus Woesearchaeota archaeon]
MLSDKDLKAKYKPIFWKSPERFYPVETLTSEGYSRNICKNCKKPFWSVSKRDVCMDPLCSKNESFGFIGKSPSKTRLNYIEVWLEFSKMFKKLGYTPIKRYPIVARWHPTLEYANASIAAFQPYVISGEVEPPANPLVIPQLCFRTTDIDNVGLTGSHMTVFSMIGQHAFVKPKDWSQNKYFQDIYQWLRKGLGLPKDEIVFHEDAWAGNNNLGPCLEYFSRGCELGNQVYMMYEQVSDSQVADLKIKVLDMGMGMERNAWFSQGTNTIYEASFPKTLQKLHKETGLKTNSNLIKKYVPYAGMLNVDEVSDIEKAWKDIARKLKLDVKDLKENVLPQAALYSIAEHSRALLVMFVDGALPSN